MPFDIGTLGQSAAGGAAGGIMGLIFGGMQDKRQVAQQEKLNKLQENTSKNLMDYQNQKAMDMWNQTNYEAQVGQLKKAGLNPALLYGMKGGGGVTTGNASSSAGGSNAHGSSGEAMQGMGMGLQLGMQAKMLEIQDKLAGIQERNVTNQERDTTSAIAARDTETQIRNMAMPDILKHYKEVADYVNTEKFNKAADTGLKQQAWENINNMFPQELAKLKQEIENLKTNQKLDQARVNEVTQWIEQSEQEIKESAQRISESNTRMALMKEETFKVMQDSNLSYAQKERVWEEIRNTIIEGDILNLEKRLKQYEVDITDQGWRHPIAEGVFDVLKGIGTGWGIGKGARMIQGTPRAVRGFHNRQ